MEFLDLRENGEKCDTDYKACLEKIRENYFSDNDKNKNRMEKPNVYNGKKFCDFSGRDQKPQRQRNSGF